MRNIMNWMKNGALFFVATILAFKLGDLTIGFLHQDSEHNVESQGNARSILLKEINPNYVAILTPPDAYFQATDSLVRRGYTVRTDENGFILNGNPSPQNTMQNTKIFFLGGSTTETLYVDESQRWPSILERRLNDVDTPDKYEVFNGGASGNHTMHSLLNLIAKVIEKQPDYVVLMNNINDLLLLEKTGSYWNAPPSRSLIQNHIQKNILFSLAHRLKNWFIPNSYQLFEAFLSKPKNEFGAFRNQSIYDIDDIEPQFRSALETFIYVCRVWDIEPILMTQFNRININDALFQRIYTGTDIEQFVSNYHRFNDVIMSVGLKHNVDVIDLANIVPSTSHYIYDAVHLNKKGSTLVGDVLFDYFLSRFQL